MSNSTTPQMSCPEGGTFYSCLDNSKFIGCCASDPCGNNGCPAGNLYAASLPKSQYGVFPDQECDAGQFFTCAYVSPPFWGCCKSSACTDGCSTKDLAGAYLSGNPSDSAPFAALNDSFVDTSSKTSTSATLSSTSAGPTASSTGAGSLEVTSSSHGSSNNTGAIAGGVVGGLAILAALIFGMTWLLRRRRKAAAEQQHNVQQPEAATYAAPGMAKQDMNGYYYQQQSPPQQFSTPPQQFSQYSPQTPQAPFSPGPPSYISEQRDTMHFSHELPNTAVVHEMGRQQNSQPSEKAVDERSGNEKR